MGRSPALLAKVVELEAKAFLTAMQDLQLPDGRALLVWHGHGPERGIQTGIAPMLVARLSVRDLATLTRSVLAHAPRATMA